MTTPISIDERTTDAMGVPLVAVHNCSFLAISSHPHMAPVVAQRYRDFDWEGLLGVKATMRPELFIRRAIVACSQQFNFWQDKTETVSNNTVWEWCRSDMAGSYRFFEKMNLPDVRVKIMTNLSDIFHRFSPLVKALKVKDFWSEVNRLSNPSRPDVVMKKTVLLKFICDSAGFEVYNTDRWGYACVDYNALVTLNHLGVLSVPGGLWAKEALDAQRVKAYSIIKGYVEETGLNPRHIDYILLAGGRAIREAHGDKVLPKVPGEFNY